MNPIDRAIKAVAPRMHLQRQLARAKSDLLDLGQKQARSYEAASGAFRLGNWGINNLSANALSLRSLPRLRARARELGRNNSWAGKAPEVVASNLTGKDGLMPIPVGVTKSETKKLMKLWKEWTCNPLEIDAEGDLNFLGLQTLCMENMVESGEFLLRRRQRRLSDGLVVPLQIQGLEPDHLADELGEIQSPSNGNRIIQGIEVDRLNRRVAYHLHKSHPGDSFPESFESAAVPAASIIHAFRKKRGGQIRGIPWGARCLVRLRDWDTTVDAETTRVQASATLAGIIRRIEGSDGPGLTGNSASSDTEKLMEELEPATFLRLQDGEDITMLNPSGFPELEVYARLTLQEIAAGFNIPYSALTGDLTKVNFSSARVGRMDFSRMLFNWRNTILIAKVCDPVWKWFMEAAVFSGKFDRPVKARWTQPATEFLEPVKEMAVIKAQLRSGTLSLSEACLILGRDYQEVVEELAADKATAEKRGLVFEAFPDHQPSAGASPSKAAQDKKKPTAGSKSGKEDETSATP